MRAPPKRRPTSPPPSPRADAPAAHSECGSLGRSGPARGRKAPGFLRRVCLGGFNLYGTETNDVVVVVVVVAVAAERCPLPAFTPFSRPWTSLCTYRLSLSKPPTQTLRVPPLPPLSSQDLVSFKLATFLKKLGQVSIHAKSNGSLQVPKKSRGRHGWSVQNDDVPGMQKYDWAVGGAIKDFFWR